MTTEHEEIQALAARKPPAKFELVVNRGAGTIDSPTLEVSWRFPDEVIALRPTHILVFLWYVSDDGQNKHHEERYAFPVTDAVGYIPLYWAGQIRIFGWALSDEALQCKRCLVRMKKTDGLIKRSIDRTSENEFTWNPGENKLRGIQEDLMASGYVYEGHYGLQWLCDQDRFHDRNHFPLAAVAELDLRVPAEIFAPRPKTWLTRALWKWVNLWHDREPVDECSYRRRMMIAFTIQPPLELIWWILKSAYKAVSAPAKAIKKACVNLRQWLKDEWRECCKRPTPLPEAESPEKQRIREAKDQARRQKILQEAELSAQKEKEAYAAWLAKNCGTHTPCHLPRPLGLPQPKPREVTLAKRVRLIYSGLKAHLCRTYDRGNKS